MKLYRKQFIFLLTILSLSLSIINEIQSNYSKCLKSQKHIYSLIINNSQNNNLDTNKI